MVGVKFDRYYRYDDLTRIMHEFAAEYPNLVVVESIGKSYEGRDIWMATVTNQTTGAAADKPAVWVHGNIHAVEVSTSSACLHLLYTLTQGYGNDQRLTHLLDSRAYYICPRLNPDGAQRGYVANPHSKTGSVHNYGAAVDLTSAALSVAAS